MVSPPGGPIPTLSALRTANGAAGGRFGNSIPAAASRAKPDRPAVIVPVLVGSSEQFQSPPLSAPVLRLHFRCRVTDAKKWSLVPLKTKKKKNTSKEGFRIWKKVPLALACIP